MLGTVVGQFGLTTAQKEILWAGGILIAVLIAAGFVLGWIRKRWGTRRAGGGLGGEMTMDQIEALHQGGQISDEEFSALRRGLMKKAFLEKESGSKLSRSDSIIDDSEEGRRHAPETPEAPEDP
ncbi:MAG: hypothetical protein JW849_07880 [Phycisphaerae bacterium]|nr:hypothetical protein [Phycisphaerae bacterium]